MTDILAYDRVGTVRTIDEDGRLKVARTPISKANVCPYYGREIPDPDGKLKLDPDKLYNLLRAPDELAKAAPTFNGLPVLEEHFHATADNPRRDLTVGSTGEGAEFDAPYLYNSLVVWDGEAIERIKSGEQRELSSAYRYTADMTPGVYEGEKYDGIMRDIRGSHVAIVPEGRAGPDVLVADSKPKMDTQMVKHTTSKKDALFERLRPYLAQDADPEACKAAMDEDEIDDDVAEDDADLEKSREDRLTEAGFSADEVAKMCGALDTAEDECAEDEEQTEEDREHEREGEERHEDRERRDRRDEREGEEKHLEREKIDREHESEGAKAAMDAAVKAAVREITRKQSELYAAREAVKPYVGVVTMDSAEGVYGFALTKAGYKLNGIPKSAYRAMFEQHNRMSVAATTKPKVGMDSKAALSFRDKFPGIKNIKKG